MIKVLPIAIASFLYFIVGFANATKNRPETGNENNRILGQDVAESSLSMISSKEWDDFSLGGSLVGFLREPKPEPSGNSGKRSDAKSKESKSTKTKSAKSEAPTPPPMKRRALREGELPLKEDVPLEGRLEIIKSMESIGAKRDATFSEEYDLISKKSCDSLIQHVDTSLQYDIDSGVELPMLSGGAEDEYESSFSPSFNGGLANQYIKKLCECAELYE